MNVSVELQRGQFQDILRSFYKVVTGDEDLEMDINMIAHTEDRVELFVNRTNTLQILHEMKGEGETDITVDSSSNFVFSSEILYKLVSDAGEGPVVLEFEENEYRFKTGDNWFTSPTEFNLNLFHGSEYSPPTRLDGFHSIAEINRESMLQNLNMMNNIAPEVKIKIQASELVISVDDQVQGAGKVKKDISPPDSIIGLEHNYSIRPLKNYLESQNTGSLDLKLNEDGVIKLESNSNGLSSEMILAHKINQR